MSFCIIPMACEDCGEKWQTSFGIVGMTQIAGPTKVCPKCGSPKIKNRTVWRKANMSDEKVGQGIAEALNNALNNPPFDPTGVTSGAEPPSYFIKTRQLAEYPESGQSFDNVAWSTTPAPCPAGPGFWAALFGPTKADLRREIEALKDERDKNLTTYAGDLWELRRQVSALQKTNNDYRFSIKQKDRAIEDHFTSNMLLRHNLAVANEEIMRMTPAPKKRGRPKKAGK
jgi:hypothetical protein